MQRTLYLWHTPLVGQFLRIILLLRHFRERMAYFGISPYCFILSGFLMEYNYGHRLSNGGWRAVYNFLLARFARLYPLYAALLCFWLLVGRWAALPGSARYRHFSPDADAIVDRIASTPYTPFTWTISTEWCFYLIFIPFSYIFRDIARPQRMLIALMFLALILLSFIFYYNRPIIRFLLVIPYLFDRGDLNINLWDWLTYYSPATRVFEFLVGCLCARSLRRDDLTVSRAGGSPALGSGAC